MCSISVEPMPSMMSRSNAALPAAQDLGGERLGGGDAHAHAGQVVLGRVGQVDHRAVERGHGEEQARALALGGLQQAARVRPARAQHGRRAHPVREREVVAQPVRVVELGRGERHVALGDLQDLAGERLARVRDVVVQVHDALREAGRAAAEQPERHVVAVGVGGVGLARVRVEERRRAATRRSAGALEPPRRSSTRVLGHHHRARRSRGCSGGSSPRVQERHRRGHGAHPHRAQEDRGERGRVVEDHQHAVLAAARPARAARCRRGRCGRAAARRSAPRRRSGRPPWRRGPASRLRSTSVPEFMAGCAAPPPTWTPCSGRAPRCRAPCRSRSPPSRRTAARRRSAAAR